MQNFKQRIEQNDKNEDGYNTGEFYSLIEGDTINHEKILTGLADEETLKALKALFLKDHSNLSELIKATVLDGNKPAGLEWKYVKVNGSDTQKDFIDLCFLGWVMQNQEEDTSSFTEADFVAKAKEYYKNNIEKKEVIIQKDVAAEGINEVATTTVTRDGDGLSEIDNVSNIGSAEINVEAGASSTRMSESGAYELFSDNIARLETIKNSFKDTSAIDVLIVELGGDKKLSELKNYNKITDIVGGRENQYGNAILILARLTEGFIQSLEKISEKAVKDGDKSVVDLKLKITRDKCKIGNNGEVDADRYLNIYGKVEGVTSEEAPDENGETVVVPEEKKKKEKKKEEEKKEEKKKEEKKKEEQKQKEKQKQKENTETLTNKSGSARRFIIANRFGLDINKVDQTKTSWVVGGYKGLKFSNITEIKDAKTGKITQTFILEVGNATKGILKYTNVKKEFTVIKNADGSYNKSEFESKHDLNQTMTLNNSVDKYTGIVPDGFEIKTVEEDKLICRYVGDKLTAVSGSEIIIEMPINKATGVLDYAELSTETINTANNKWIEINPANIDAIISGYTVDEYTGVTPIDGLRFYASMGTNGKLKIVNNLKNTSTNNVVYEDYKEVKQIKEHIEDVGDIQFGVYQSETNESPSDKLAFTSGYINRLGAGKYQYETTLSSNSGAITYKLVAPFTLGEDKNGDQIKKFGNIEITSDPKGQAEQVDGGRLIDGMIYKIITKGERIGLAEDETARYNYMDKKHPEGSGYLKGKVPEKSEKLVLKEGETKKYIKAITTIPGFNIENIIIQKNNKEKNGSIEQEVHIGDQDVQIHYDENGTATYMSYENNGTEKILLFEEDKNPVITMDYLGGKKMALEFVFDKDGEFSIQPKYGIEGGFKDKEALENKILEDKTTIYNQFASLKVDNKDIDNFKFPTQKNINDNGANLDKDRGEGSMDNRIKGPNRKGIYSVVVVEGKNRWTSPKKHNTNFELHFKFDQYGKMELVNADGTSVTDNIVKMPLKYRMETRLAKNYSFSIDSNGELKATAVDKAIDVKEKIFNVGESFKFMGESKRIQEVHEDGKIFRLFFDDGTSGSLQGEGSPLKIKKYPNYVEMSKDLIKFEGEGTNTLMKKTLLNKFDKIYSARLHSGYDKKEIRNYIATMGPDDDLFNAIPSLIKNSERSISKNKQFVPVLIEGVLDLRLVDKKGDIDSFTEDTEDRGLRDKMLGRLTRQVSYIKRAEDIGLDTSKAGTRGLKLYPEANLRQGATRENVLGGKSEQNIDKKIIYKLNVGVGEPVNVELKIAPQTGRIELNDRVEVKDNNMKYDLYYDRKTNNITVKEVSRIKEETE